MVYMLGRNRPLHRPRLRLGDYKLAGLPSPPPSVYYGDNAKRALSQMYLNDQLGDCVPACIEHLDGVFVGNAGDGDLIFPDNITKALYSAIGGYVDGDESTDQGCDEQTALNYWRDKGLPPDGSHKIDGWIGVNGADEEECMLASWLFENLVFGVEMPDAWITPFPEKNGFVWNVAGDPNPDNGHCFGGLGYTYTGVCTSTWGLEGTIAWPAVAKYTSTPLQGELYTVLSQDIINRATLKAPSGFDFAKLQADLKNLRPK